jgi:hypothetical protein
MPLLPETIEKLVRAQRNEITEHQIYRVIAARTRKSRNREILERIARMCVALISFGVGVLARRFIGVDV